MSWFKGIPDISALDAKTYNTWWQYMTAWWNDHDSGARPWTVVNANAYQFNGLPIVKTMQVVQGTMTTAFSTTSSTYQASGLKATIIPTSVNSKIRITLSTVIMTGTPAAADAIITIKRGSTDIALSTNGFLYCDITAQVSTSTSYVDSPATASSVVYEAYLKNDDNATTVKLGQSGVTSVIILEEIL